MTTITKLGELMDVGSVLRAKNDAFYRKLTIKLQNGFDTMLMHVNFFIDGDFDFKIPAGTKVKLEVQRNGKFWKLISIVRTQFMDCMICKYPYSNAYEALNCDGCLNPRKVVVKDNAEIVGHEIRGYKFGPGLNLSLLINGETLTTVIFKNGLFYNQLVTRRVGETIAIEAWVVKDNLINITEII